jgi:hypothetical protein
MVAVFFALFLRVSEGRVVALQVAKDYNIGQRYFAGSSSVTSGFVFPCFLCNTRRMSEDSSFHSSQCRKVFSMEQFDTDIEYMSNAPRPSTPAERLSILYIFPILGVLLVLFFVAAFAFQWNISVLVDNLVVLMVVLFFIFTGIVFWGLAPRRS